MNRFLNIDPIKGLATSIVSFFVGISPEVSRAATPAAGQMSNVQTDTIFIVQLIAFAITIIAGTLTAINGWHRLCEKHKAKKSD